MTSTETAATTSITDALAAKNREPEPDAAAPAEKQKREGAEYVVLRWHATEGDMELWQDTRSNVVATSADDAIRKVGIAAGEYVAVPARSFRPRVVTVETVSRVRLEDA